MPLRASHAHRHYRDSTLASESGEAPIGCGKRAPTPGTGRWLRMSPRRRSSLVTTAKPTRFGFAARRATAAAAVGALVLIVALLLGAGWSVALLVGWDVAAVLVLTGIWWPLWQVDASTTAAKASAEDDSRAAAQMGLLAAGVASLVADAFTLNDAGHSGHEGRLVLTLLAVVSVLLAWAVVHTVYALRYARLYYTPPGGGIDFGDHDPPDYRDLAYVAFTIGMTFQVSDTDLTSRRLRRTAIHHALLSYLFGTVILAITVNAIGGLIAR